MFHYNPDNKILQALSFYFDLVLLAALWVLTSLPIVTIGVSTTAMYRVLLKMITVDGVSGVTRAFFGYWRGEWRRSTQVWALLAGLLLLAAGDLLVCLTFRPEGGTGLLLWAVSILAAALSLCLLVYVFPINAQFDCTVRQVFSNAIRFTAGNLGGTLELIVLLALMAAGSLFLQFLSIFIVGPLLYLAGKRLSRIFQPLRERYLENKEREEDIR